MLTLQQIREDLSEIRYYYSKQKMFDAASKTVIQSYIIDKVNAYNQAIKDAPVRLYDLYVSLYVMNNTQEALAFDWNCTSINIAQQNKKLCEFLLQKLSQNYC